MEPVAFGYLDQVPKGKEQRLAWTEKRARERYGEVAKRFRKVLIADLGDDAGGKVNTAEAFEVCEYGSQPSHDELRRLFPFFGEK